MTKPGPKKDPKAKGGLRQSVFTEREFKLAEARKAAAAVDVMWASRPLKPPPSRGLEPRTITAAAAALAEDRRKGILGRDFRLDAGDE